MSRQEFIASLAAHDDSLTAEILEIRTRISTITDEVAQVKVKRKERIREYALSLLPDLRPETADKIGQFLPGFISRASLQKSIESAERVYKDELKTLDAVNEERLTSNRQDLVGRLASAEQELGIAQEVYDTFMAIPNLERLIEREYGTNAYPYRFYNIFEYFPDWKAADEITDELKLSHWRQVVDQHQAHATNRRNLSEILAGLEREFDALERKIVRVMQLKAALAKAPNDVLDMLRIQLEAKLTAEDPPPGWMSDVVFLNAQLVRLQNEQQPLEDARARLSKEQDDVRALKRKVERSRREVPKEYMQYVPKARTGKQPLTSGRPSSRAPRSSSASHQRMSPAVVYVDHPDHFFDGMMYGQMVGYFDQPDPLSAPAERYRGSSHHNTPTRNDDRVEQQRYHEARNDTRGWS